MLLMSAIEEAEIERWRAPYTQCCLPPAKKRPKPSVEEVLKKLPGIMGLFIGARFKSGGWLGPICLKPEEVADITIATKMVPREIMVLLLDVASALAQGTAEDAHIGAVVETDSGAMYVGSPLTCLGNGTKFVVHGVQTALLNAWHQGDIKVRNLMVETPPCLCCRQFIRELWDWNRLRLIHAVDGPLSIEKGSIVDLPFDRQGLKVGNIRSNFLREARQGIKVNKSDSNDLINIAAKAAAHSYAPYSRNFAGAALRTKHGTVHQGRYAECCNSLAGVLAMESALINMALSGEKIADISEMLLVETRGEVTQFSTTQKLAHAMGNIPFRFMLAGK